MEKTADCVPGSAHGRGCGLRRFVCAAVLVLLGLPVVRVEAAPIVFDLTVNFTVGTLMGQSFGGSLSVDGADCTGTGGACQGQFVPGGVSGGVEVGDLLSLDITIDGTAFSLANASPTTEPTVYFNNDTPTFFNVAWSIGDVYLSLVFGQAFYDVGLPPLFGSSDAEGSITSGGRQSVQQPVPEPASLALLTLGLASAGVRRWRHRRS